MYVHVHVRSKNGEPANACVTSCCLFLQADLVVRDAALASLQQECQKLRKELEGNAMNFERQVGGLKEELQLLQEKKTSLEVNVKSTYNVICRILLVLI